MPNRAAANTGKIIHRTEASGGSVGGNMKQGLVRFSAWSMINAGYMKTRVGPPSCCVPMTVSSS